MEDEERSEKQGGRNERRVVGLVEKRQESKEKKTREQETRKCTKMGGWGCGEEKTATRHFSVGADK